MKKQYQAPIARTVKLLQQTHLLSGSPTNTRFAGGTPTMDASNGYDLPTDVYSTSGVPDVQSMFGKGQASGTNRSREFDWDD